MPYHFAAESRACLDALPATVPTACSTAVGWTSLLVRHSRCAGSPDPYDTLPTSDLKLVVVTRGEVDVDVHKRGTWRRAVYRPGTAGLSVPGEVDRLRLRVRGAAGEFEKLHVFVPHALVAEAADHLRRPGQRLPPPMPASLTLNDRAIAQTAGALLSAMRDAAPDFYAEAAAQWLAVQLVGVRGPAGTAEEPRRIGPVADARLRRALDYLAANLGQPLTLGAVAKEAGVSKFHFTRLFRERVGASPMRYLSDLRLSTAARLLRTSDLPLAQIGAECGYPHVTHFHDAFRRRYGCAPGAYRKRS